MNAPASDVMGILAAQPPQALADQAEHVCRQIVALARAARKVDLGLGDSTPAMCIASEHLMGMVRAAFQNAADRCDRG